MQHYHPSMRLVLASGSPRRSELLAAAGFKFDVEPPDVDERRLSGETPEQYVERMACLKARTIGDRHPEQPVLGADTVVVIDGDVLGKPVTPDDAAAMLRRLSGRAHQVLTGVAVAWQGRLSSAVEATTVWMEPISVGDLAEYVSSGEPLDKAGAYAIQGLASRFVSRIEGSYANVVGLPVAKVAALLRASTAARP